MSVQSLEKTVKTKFPKDFKDLFGQIIDSGGQVRLKLHNDDFMLIDKFVPRSITGREEYDYNYLVMECIIPCLIKCEMYNGELIIPFARSTFGDGFFYLFYTEKKNIFQKSEYAIWMVDINSCALPIRIADSMKALVGSNFEIDTWDKALNFKEQRSFSSYLENFPQINSNPTLDLERQYIDIQRTDFDSKWEYKTYLKLIKVEVSNNIFRKEEILVEHRFFVSGYNIHYQIPVEYGNEIGDFWFEGEYYVLYGTRENYRNFNFFRKMGYIILTLNRMIKQLEIDLPNFDKREIAKLLDSYDIRSVVNKSHMEWELCIP